MTKLYLGVLSGTSMDAIDMAAVDFNDKQPRILATLSEPLPSNYQTTYRSIIKAGNCTINELGELDNWTGELFANAVLNFLQQHKIDTKSIQAIGSHGQTIWHAPDGKRPFTMQIGDPNVIAVKTGITTIADFRRADMAAGGKGAPFAPAFHQAVFADPNEDRCVINIGGISNISVLSQNEYKGFDIGPGNCLMDRCAQNYFKLDYDKDGEIASCGAISDALLAACLNDPYFSKLPPKSTGIEYFNEAWLQAKMQQATTENLQPNDIMATLLELTTNTIATTIKNLKLNNPRVFLCGGGAKNISLCASLSKQLGQTVQTTQALGIDPAWVEAALFAWLAKQNFTRTAVDLRAITGAKQKLILGAVYG